MCANGNVMAQSSAGVPDRWMKRWVNPPAEDRPLQIIHGIDPQGRGLVGTAQMVTGSGTDEFPQNGMRFYKDLGLGGVVCNVMWQDYLRSEPAWKALVTCIEDCRRLGIVIWIYDEAGYPSGAAGGLVLEEHPEYEAQELAYDASQPDPFVLRAAYEFTHASNNYYATRRYINLIDDRAVHSFIENTHQAYRNRLGDGMGTVVKAFFTDEPSLITVNLGQIPESARKKVPVKDPINPNAKALPAVPWVYDLPQRYQERYGEDILAVRRSLFTGETEADRRTRRQYWSLIAELVADRYYGTIRKWCAGAGVASSGHNLWEEALMHHPTLYGNGLKALSCMDIPGLDELSSNPEAVINGHWMTAALPASAAIMSGGRRIFTEVSDFTEKQSGAEPASVADMQATAAWQAAFGVTDFTLYYNTTDRSGDDYRAYCACVGRLNAILKSAKLDPDVLLYYPVHDLWSEYKPVAEPLNVSSQTPRAQNIVGSFLRLGQTLTQTQIPFALIDHDFLAGASVRTDGSLLTKGHAFRALVLPEDVELPAAAARIVARFTTKGGRVMRDTPTNRLTAAALQEGIKPRYRLTANYEQVVLGRFVRDDRPVLVAVNVGRTAYAGALTVGEPGAWTRMEPATGTVKSVATGADGCLELALGPRQAVVLVGGKVKH